MKEIREGPAIERDAAAVGAAARTVPGHEDLALELAALDAACARGYFLPDEDELVRLRYSQYLMLRTSLLETIRSLGDPAAGTPETAAFATAFAATCVLRRADRYLVDLAAERPVVWKKLDEEDPRCGIPRKTFTRIYQAMSDPEEAIRFLLAVEYLERHRGELAALSKDPVLAPVVALLEEERPRIERRKREAVRRRMSYRWFSFLRRHRSAWKQVMGGLFEVSGRAIADLRQPGAKPAGVPKRIGPELRDGFLRLARPADIVVTRHDDALSNWFLPGHWPHAALYLGCRKELAALGIELPPAHGNGPWFLEAKKDGVRVRDAAETLEVDAAVLVRPPGVDAAAVLRRALEHEGKPYDFLFDFRTADRMVCTEVVYRAYHGIGGVGFQLTETGGRLCLPAEEMLDQAMDHGFRVVATAGAGPGGLLSGPAAELAFHNSRQPF
ncbi:MAG: hypothetical protein H7A48_07445 [Akkermansiaceae bacterium]|nr:hypothetical protein [Akkermansiaceae bacterium]MCP5547332.1 hypothetical protein [Akkermansiaceae bacterium]